jgi:hypothetical protein
VNRNRLGFVGEQHVARALKRAGAVVSAPAARGHGDVRAVTAAGRVLYVEVKTARASTRGAGKMWRWCLNRRAHHAARQNADYVVLLAWGTYAITHAYVIPAAAIAGVKNIAMRNLDSARSKYARYRQPIASIVED